MYPPRPIRAGNRNETTPPRAKENRIEMIISIPIGFLTRIVDTGKRVIRVRYTEMYVAAHQSETKTIAARHRM